jgi:LCP family protein required for cell wall assembly
LKKHRILLLLNFLVLTFFFSWGIILINNLFAENNRYFSKTSEVKENNDSLNLKAEELKAKDPLNVLLLGLDDGGYRSDVIMLMNYVPMSGQIKFISIPRDTMVRYKGNTGKINALYAYGKEELAKNTMESLTGLKINYYITVDFAGFRKIIDTLGGVYLNVPINMNYDDPTQGLSIHLNKGYQVLNGKKAEEFVRYRKSDTPEGKEIGDLGRIDMQLYLMKELIDQKLDIKYILKLDDLFDIFKKNVRTNIKLSEINEYVPYASKIAAENIKSFTVPGESKLVNEIWYYIVDLKKTTEIIRENFATS